MHPSPLGGRHSFALSLLACCLSVLGAVLPMYGCGSPDHPPDTSGDSWSIAGKGGGGPCTFDGEVRTCHVTLGSHAGILSCFHGTQTCQGGVWGACGGAGDITAQSNADVRLRASEGSGGGLSLDSLSTPTGCVNNPCDPSCQIYTEVPDAGIVPDGSATIVGITGGSLANSNVPNGFQNKGNDPNNVCSTCPLGSTSAACQSACQFDMQCAGNGMNGCTAFDAGAAGSCTGVDLTVPVTCENADGTVEVSVCSRGTVAVPPGVQCYVYPGNSPQYPADNPGLGTPVMTTQTTIAPGTCESQALPGALFPSGGTESLMCNPPNIVTTTSTEGPSYASVTSTAGAWLNTQNVYAADGVDSTLPMPDSSQANTFSSTSQNIGWTSTNNMMATASDGAYATAAVTAPSGAATVTKLPTANSVVSGSWSNASNAYSASDANASATSALALPTTVTLPASGTLGATTTTGNLCDGVASGACLWTSGTNGDARYAEGIADGVSATATLSKGDDAVAFLGGYPFTGANAVPSNAVITQISATVTWKQSTASTRYTGGLALYAGNGATMVGTECTSTALGTSATTLTCSATTSQLQAAGFSLSDLTSAQLVRIHANHANSGGSNSYTVSVDSVTVQVQYQVPTTSSIMYRGFGLNVSNSIPSTATINSLTVTANLKSGSSNAFASLSFQPYKNSQSTAIGVAATTVTNPSTTFTTSTNSPSVIGLTPADLTDANFGVLVSAFAATAAWTAYVDYIQVTVGYSNTSGSNQTITLNGFGFDSIVPAGATIESVTTEVRWKSDVANNTNATLGVEAVAGGTVLGSELTTPSSGPPTTATTASYAVTSGVTASQLYDANNFRVKLRATSTGGSNFTAYVDYVKVTVVWATTLTSTMTVGHFGLVIPASATITGLTLTTKWSVSATNTGAQLGLQAFSGGSAIDTEATTTSGASPPTTDTVFTATPSVVGLTPASFANGTFTVNVRGTRTAGSAPVTANVDYVTATVTYTTSNNEQIAECNYSNDWSVSKQNPALACQNVTTGGYATRTYTQTYTSSCPAGTRTQWAYLAYDTTTPSDVSGSSDVKFQIQTVPSLSDGGAGTPTSWVTAADAPGAGDPAVCAMGGPSPCPKDLYAALGGLPAADNPTLNLQVTLTPSPDSQVAPTLNTWQITYSCPPSE